MWVENRLWCDRCRRMTESGHWGRTRTSSVQCRWYRSGQIARTARTFNSQCDQLLCRWKTFVTVLDVLSFRCHSWQYLARWARSAVHSILEKVSAWRALQPAAMALTGRSLVYMLNNVRAKREPWGKPFTCLRQKLTSSPIWTWKRCSSSCTVWTHQGYDLR